MANEGLTALSTRSTTPYDDKRDLQSEESLEKEH
jgi:hypothetical protein